MQKRFNILVPLTCPRCKAELLSTLDQIQREESAQCAWCGTTFELQNEVPPPMVAPPESQDFVVL
jgi:transcription elongation factor Elf1